MLQDNIREEINTQSKILARELMAKMNKDEVDELKLKIEEYELQISQSEQHEIEYDDKDAKKT